MQVLRSRPELLKQKFWGWGPAIHSIRSPQVLMHTLTLLLHFYKMLPRCSFSPIRLLIEEMIPWGTGKQMGGITYCLGKFIRFLVSHTRVGVLWLEELKPSSSLCSAPCLSSPDLVPRMYCLFFWVSWLPLFHYAKKGNFAFSNSTNCHKFFKRSLCDFNYLLRLSS